MEEPGYESIGSMMINSGAIDITDPGYDADTWCRINNLKVKPGKYDCYIYPINLSSWGERVAVMRIAHEKAKPFDTTHFKGTVGVDAGLMSISEAGTKPDYDYNQWLAVLKDFEQFEKTHPHQLAHVMPLPSTDPNAKKQFWSPSGIGDGEYGVYIVDTHDPQNEEAIPDMIEVVFFDEDDLWALDSIESEEYQKQEKERE